MDMVRNEVRNLNFDEFTRDQVARTRDASRRMQRNYQDFLIVDVDSHHYENESYKEVFSYIESPVIKREAMEFVRAAAAARPSSTARSAIRASAGRITRHESAQAIQGRRGEHHRDIDITKEWMDAMGVDYACLFPTPMLFLGLHPQVEVETAMCRAYNRWLCERVLAHEPRIVSMLYLPFNDPEAAYKTSRISATRRASSASW